MEDPEPRRRIRPPADSEHRLERPPVGKPPDQPAKARPSDPGEALDRCRDLLRRRRTGRPAGDGRTAPAAVGHQQQEG